MEIDGTLEACVDAIEIFRKSIEAANVGDNIGVLFKEIEKSQLDRGSVLTSSSSRPTVRRRRSRKAETQVVQGKFE